MGLRTSDYEDPSKAKKDPIQPDLGPGHDAPSGRPGDLDPRGHDVAAGDPSDPRGDGPDSLGDSLQQAEDDAGGLYNPGGGSKSDKTDSPSKLKDSEQSGDDSLYNPNDRQRFPWPGRKNNGGGNGGFMGFIKRNKLFAAVLATSGSTGLVAIAALMFFGGFGLTNFMKNVEEAGFQRYQVDLNGRSDKWLQAYIQLRFGEVYEDGLEPKDRDNLLFRADSVSRNKPLRDWYKNLRGKTGAFEQDLFEKEGIRFTGGAYRDGNMIKFRAGVISFKDTDTRLTFDPSLRAMDAINQGDPNAFNGELRDFVELKMYKNDKEARAAIRAIVNENYPNWWKAVKRYHLRHDIQNMIGVRSWRFFETTRDKLSEKKISVRNKIITKALPEDSKSGAFIKCLFGIPDCQGSTDPANPKAREFSPTGTKKDPDKTDSNVDNPQPVGDGSGEESIEAGSNTSGEAGTAARKILAKLVSRASILSLLDSLARFDKAIKNHTLSKVVTQAKTAQYVGMFTVFGVASDQLTTGEVSSEEVGAFMDQFSNPTNNEGWSKVIDPPHNNDKASAASEGFVDAKNKEEFCSEEHQAAMLKPENRQKAENEYQRLCPENRAGGKNKAAELEEAWNKGPGFILHPFLAAYHAATGGIFDIFNSVADAITGPIVNETLTAMGLDDDVKEVSATVAEQALDYGGANTGINDNTPSGQVAMGVIQGGAGAGEMTMRYQGGASTTQQAAALAGKNIAAYQAEQAHSSFTNRYLALSNHKSLLSRQLFAISNLRLSSLGNGLSGFGSTLLNSFGALLKSPVKAQELSGYEAANFAGIETFDMPSECLDAWPLAMTPQSSTNADELGLFAPDELNWDMMSNKEAWYDALYSKVNNNEEKAKKVWNCALFDNTVRGGMSAKYGYRGEDAFGGAEEDSGSNATETAGAKINLAKLGEDSTSVACAPDTKDLGEADGYTGGKKIRINICAVLGFPSTGQESNGGYGVSGADGNVVVNSRVSGAVAAMVKAAKEDGVKLAANSSFRTMSHQQELCNGDGGCSSGSYDRVARPGTSNHQLGAAIDFAGGLPSTAGPIPGNQFWNWLSKNASKFDYKNYPAEAWHWSPTGS